MGTQPSPLVQVLSTINHVFNSIVRGSLRKLGFILLKNNLIMVVKSLGFFSINRHDDIFEESMCRFYVAEMIQAINALHCMGYVHR